MINKTLLTLLVLTLFSLTFISAGASSLDDVAQFDCVSLSQKYANSTYSNVTTLTYPNGTQQVVNWAMSGSNGIWYYNFCDTSQIGSYEYCTRTDVDGEDVDVCIDFEVTPDGFSNNVGFYFLILILSGGLVVFGLGMKDAIITILGSFGLYFISLYILFNGIAGMKDPIYTWAIGLILLGLAMYISIRSTYELIVD
jgi:hypothetical protein